jgi:hypothetical protein
MVTVADQADVDETGVETPQYSVIDVIILWRCALATESFGARVSDINIDA